MSQVSDKQIINWIRDKSYSKLMFLDGCWQSSENEWYLGFYYFIQDLKLGNKDEVFNAIVSRFGGESFAYSYLGKTADKIYNSFDRSHVAASFYRKAIALNKKNSDAYWGLYRTALDISSCLESLRLDYECCFFDKLNNKFRQARFHLNDLSVFSKKELFLLKNIISDEKVSCSGEILISACFYLDEFNEGLVLIDAMDNVDKRIIKAYFDKKLISLDMALSKLYYSNVGDFIGDDHQRVYQLYVDESKKGNPNPNRAVLIQKAFRAEKFDDVIVYHNEVSSDDLHFQYDVNSHLYYLLAQSFLDQKLDEKTLKYVNSKSDSLRSGSIVLNKAFRVEEKIKGLNKELLMVDCFDNKISCMGLYQDAKEILNAPDLINHFLYDRLNNSIKSLKNNWNNRYYHNELLKMKAERLTGSMNSDDLLRLCNLGIKCEDYDYVIESIIEFQNSNAPTMSLCSSLGVCYERKKQFRPACEQYKKALGLMYSSKECNHVVISNYISCAKRLPEIEISKNEFNKLKEEYNTELANKFKWSFSTAKYRDRLFKYSPFNINTIDALTNQYFYLAEKNQLNDPIELQELLGVGADNLIDSNYRICSFTNNNNSMLMWSHYAQEHQGIMVEYWFGGDFPDGFGIEKISYEDDCKRGKNDEFYIFNQYILTKNKEWEYEDEVRLFSNRNHKVSFEAFDYPDHDRNKINAQVRSIVLGYKFPEDKKQLIANLVKSINGKRLSYEPQIVIKEAYISDENNFSLKYREIDIDTL